MPCLYIGLEAFEHKLLADFNNVFKLTPQEGTDEGNLALAVPTELWQWFATVASDYNAIFYSEEEAIDVQRSHMRAWNVFLSRISSDSLHPQFGRCATLCAQNPTFPRCLQEEDLGIRPTCKLWPDDKMAWSVLSALAIDLLHRPCLTEQTTQSPAEDQGESSSTSALQMSELEDFADANESDSEGIFDDFEPYFEVWSLLRAWTILRRNSQHVNEVEQFLMAGDFFSKHHFISEIDQDLSEPVDETFPAKGRLDQGFFLDLNNLDLNNLVLPKRIRPLSLLEFISTDELEPVDQASADLELGTARYVRWERKKLCKFEHHLFTEEEVFRYCVDADWTFPGYLDRGGILFRLTSLEECDFLRDMTNFWEKWNDIAITQDPDSNQFIVLETIPGRKFRSLVEKHSRLAGLEYFRNLAEEARSSSNPNLQEALGSDFQPDFVNQLRVIPCEQIIRIDAVPMRGAHGIVYRARWARPASIGTRKAEERDVVLKTVIATDTATRDSVFRELDSTFSATIGNNFGNIPFWGVMRTPRDISDLTRLNLGALPPDTIFLMFDFATHGSLSSYLRKTMTGIDTDWEYVYWSVSNAAEGLSQLHEAGIIHRDLHLENVLVLERQTPADGAQDSVPYAVIADYGESKMVNLPNQAVIASLRSVGSISMRPPEVHKYGDYTAKSEVFDFGRLLEEVVVLQWKRARAIEDSEEHERLPLWLCETIQQCLAMDPGDRPTSSALSKRLNSLEKDALDKRKDGPFALISFETHRSRQEALSSPGEMELDTLDD